MNQVEHSTVVDSAIHALREAIRTGQLEPGQRLVVADVSRMLNVSGGPVREAIRRLTGEGLVEIVPHRGASVRKISSSEIKELFELREAVEGLAARLAARRITPEQKEIFSNIVADLDRCHALADGENYLIANQAFHQLIYTACGNEQVRALALQLVLPIYQLRIPHRLIGDDGLTTHLEHHAIAATLLAQDEDAAAAAMQRHIRNSAASLQATLESAEPPRVRRRRASLAA